MSEAYTCEKCGEAFGSQQKLQKHEKRKTPCNPLLKHQEGRQEENKQAKYECKYCGRGFAHATNMYKHTNKTCKLRGGKAEELKNRSIQFHKKQNEALTKELEEVKAQLRLQTEAKERHEPIVSDKIAGQANLQTSGEKAPAMAITGTHNTQQVDQRVDKRKYINTINFNVFGKETHDHITEEDMAEVLIQASAELAKLGLEETNKVYAHRQAAGTAIQRIMEMIYSNEKVPKNLTCRLTNKKSSTADIRDKAGEWKKEALTVIAQAMRGKAIDVAFDRQPMGDEMLECAAILKIIREEEEKLKIDHTLTSARAVLERANELLKKLERIEIGSDAELAFSKMIEETKAPPPRKHVSKAKDDQKEIDEIFEELYGPPKRTRRPKPTKFLKELELSHALAIMKAEGLDKEEDGEPIGREKSLKLLARCATAAEPWDEDSTKEAISLAGKLFWELKKDGSPLGPKARKRAEELSVWCPV